VVATSANGLTGVIATQNVQTPSVRATADRKLVRFFTASDAAVEQMQYYLVLKKTITFGTAAIADLYLKEGGVNQLLFGKNYTAGSLDAAVDYITVDYSGAFAPVVSGPNALQQVDDLSNVFVSGNHIYFRNIAVGASVSVHDLLGRKLLSLKADAGNFSTNINTGIYIVRINEKVYKLIAR
jgi:hypothetical protein